MPSTEEAFYRILDDVNKAADGADPNELLINICNLYGLKTAAYFGMNVSQHDKQTPYLLVTYSNNWVNHYKERNFVSIDPVLTLGFSSILPIEWSGNDYRSRKLRDFFGEAAAFGIGSNGLTIPVRGRSGERALFTVTSDAKQPEWQAGQPKLMRDFHILAYHLHQMILRREGAELPVVQLAAREVECLKWKASGKTEWEIAAILGISEKTVRYYVSLAVTKLNATNATHAVAKAINQNLFLAPS